MRESLTYQFVVEKGDLAMGASHVALLALCDERSCRVLRRHHLLPRCHEASLEIDFACSVFLVLYHICYWGARELSKSSEWKLALLRIRAKKIILIFVKNLSGYKLVILTVENLGTSSSIIVQKKGLRSKSKRRSLRFWTVQ